MKRISNWRLGSVLMLLFALLLAAGGEGDTEGFVPRAAWGAFPQQNHSVVAVNPASPRQFGEGNGEGDESELVERLIQQLGDDRYQQRRVAHLRLQALGVPAVEPVGRAAMRESPEVATRAMALLEAWSRSENQRVADASVAMLRRLSEGEGWAANRSERALLAWQQFVTSRIVERLESLEAQVSVRQRSPGLHITVQISESWRGDSSDLELLGDLNGLRWLSLENSPLGERSVDFLARCEDLEYLYLGDTGIAEDRLAPLGKLTKLKHLSLKNLPVRDGVLSPLGTLENLESLGLDGTRVTDASLPDLKQFPRLRVLWLDGTDISDEGLVHLREIRGLNRLYLSKTKIEGTGLVHLAELPSLSYLTLKEVQLSPEGASQLGGMQSLETLGLDQTNVTDEMLAHLAGLTNLQVLWLSKTEITDAGLENLLGLVGLQTLYLHGAKVTRQGVERLRDEMPRCVVHF
jgi:Leucine-rich repeat (LRR) protein